jgi:hypothetical protein
MQGFLFWPRFVFDKAKFDLVNDIFQVGCQLLFPRIRKQCYGIR